MIARGVLAAIVVCVLGARTYADANADAEAALRNAQQRAAAGDPSALDALEALGAQRPITRLTDDAWRAAAQLAERAHDLARARRALEQVIATTDDEHGARRARIDLERLTAVIGGSGEWTDVARQHDVLARRIREPGDPVPALRELEQLVARHAAYPRVAMAMVSLAHGWEREGDNERAIEWLRRAVQSAAGGADRTRALAELTRTLVRDGSLDAARATIAEIADPLLAAELRGRIERAELRRTVRWIAFAVLATLVIAGTVMLRRRAGSWRRGLRALMRPPAEAIYFVPVAAVIVAVAQTANPLVARAITLIAIVGTAVAWISGTLLDLRPVQRRVIVVHAICVLVAVIAAVYIAVDRQQMIDMLIETWRGGPAMR